MFFNRLKNSLNTVYDIFFKKHEVFIGPLAKEPTSLERLREKKCQLRLFRYKFEILLMDLVFFPFTLKSRLYKAKMNELRREAAKKAQEIQELKDYTLLQKEIFLRYENDGTILEVSKFVSSVSSQLATSNNSDELKGHIMNLCFAIKKLLIDLPVPNWLLKRNERVLTWAANYFGSHDVAILRDVLETLIWVLVELESFDCLEFHGKNLPTNFYQDKIYQMFTKKKKEPFIDYT